MTSNCRLSTAQCNAVLPAISTESIEAPLFSSIWTIFVCPLSTPRCSDVRVVGLVGVEDEILGCHLFSASFPPSLVDGGVGSLDMR
jgi:hypothetical protein